MPRPPNRTPNRVEIKPGFAEVWMTTRTGEDFKPFFVDLEDLPLIHSYRWSLSIRVDKNGTRRGYVISNSILVEGKPQTVLLHRLIMNAPKGLSVDHINGNSMDNRRANLRLTTRDKQAENLSTWSPSGYRNVHLMGGCWHVSVTKSGFVHDGGKFKDLREAVLAAIELRAKVFTHHNEKRLDYLPLPPPGIKPCAKPHVAFTVKELARERGLLYSTVVNRIHRGWDLEKALNTPVVKR